MNAYDIEKLKFRTFLVMIVLFSLGYGAFLIYHNMTKNAPTVERVEKS